MYREIVVRFSRDDPGDYTDEDHSKTPELGNIKRWHRFVGEREDAGDLE